MSKLDDLLDIESFTVNEFTAKFAYESCVPGICMNPDCDCTYDYEPDATQGWCDECQTQSVTSGLVLIGII